MHNEQSTKRTVRLIPLRSAILLAVLFVLLFSLFYIDSMGNVVVRVVWSSFVAGVAAIIGFIIGIYRVAHTSVIVELKTEQEAKEKIKVKEQELDV